MITCFLIVLGLRYMCWSVVSQGTTKKAKDFLPFLQRSRRLPAIVDYVLSGARFKLMIPKETCAIAFSLSGVRSLGRGEPYADESICFMRHRILQRDVEVNVPTSSKRFMRLMKTEYFQESTLAKWMFLAYETFLHDFLIPISTHSLDSMEYKIDLS
jgi:hypothetical protein